MREDEPIDTDRIILLFLIATFLFVGALRSFLSAVYYQNLSDLGLNATVLYALALLAPALFLVPALRARPHTMLVAGALGLALGRALLAATRGTSFHLPLAATSAASFMILLGALVMMLRREHAALAGAGIALGWALDVALVTFGDSADLTATVRGLLLVVPTGAMLVLLALKARAMTTREHATRAPRGSHEGGPWLAGAMLGAWLFLENTILGNPFGAARWNDGEPWLYAAASAAGLLIGALLALRAPLARVWMLALHAALALALLDHAFVHSPVLPLLVALGQVAMALDAALLMRVLSHPRGGSALLLAGLVALLLHFAYAFTFAFAYVPLSALWEGRAPYVIAIAAILLVLPLARRALDRPLAARRARSLTALPALILIAAIVTPGAAVPEPSADGTFRIMSFNVHQGFANDGVLDPSVFLPVLEEAQPDIVVLQEADTPRFTSGNVDMVSYLAEKMGYHTIYGQPTREQAFGGAILTRFPVQEWHVYELPSDSDDRYFTEARLDIGGTDVWLYAIHFTLPRESRLAERDALLAQADTRSGPRILAGDFNSCPRGLCPSEERGTLEDDVYASVAAQYWDPWVALGHDANESTAFTFEATAPDQRIDYIFVTDDITTIAYDRVRSEAAIRASDHMPVLGEFRLTQP